MQLLYAPNFFPVVCKIWEAKWTTQAGSVLASHLAVPDMMISLQLSQVPWAVTANMACRNTAVRFDVRFPKTGGGEDVDFCIRLLSQHRLEQLQQQQQQWHSRTPSSPPGPAAVPKASATGQSTACRRHAACATRPTEQGGSSGCLPCSTLNPGGAGCGGKAGLAAQSGAAGNLPGDLPADHAGMLSVPEVGRLLM